MGAGVNEDIVKGLRKFTSAHSILLGWAGFQALQLKRVPANVRQQALLIDLNYHPSTDSLRRYVRRDSPLGILAYDMSVDSQSSRLTSCRGLT